MSKALLAFIVGAFLRHLGMHLSVIMKAPARSNDARAAGLLAAVPIEGACPQTCLGGAGNIRKKMCDNCKCKDACPLSFYDKNCGGKMPECAGKAGGVDDEPPTDTSPAALDPPIGTLGPASSPSDKQKPGEGRDFTPYWKYKDPAHPPAWLVQTWATPPALPATKPPATPRMLAPIPDPATQTEWLESLGLGGLPPGVIMPGTPPPSAGVKETPDNPVHTAPFAAHAYNLRRPQVQPDMSTNFVSSLPAGTNMETVMSATIQNMGSIRGLPESLTNMPRSVPSQAISMTRAAQAKGLPTLFPFGGAADMSNGPIFGAKQTFPVFSSGSGSGGSASAESHR